MNIISFDVEEWFNQFTYMGNHVEAYSRYDSFLSRILNKLDERNIKATFFCVGGMARKFPQVVKLIDRRGHEIGCHSDKHKWLNSMSMVELKEDTHSAISSLEDLLGKKVISYRAPAFTIGEMNKYAFEILADYGIERDASVFPAIHSFGGFSNFAYQEPCIIKYNGLSIKEFPVCTTKILGKNVAYSGGGYFRLFPLWFVKNRMAKNSYNMSYFHIFDLIGIDRKDDATFESYYKIPATRKNRFIREFKSNIGTKGAFEKLMTFIESLDFINLSIADEKIDWDSAPVVCL